MHDIRRLNMEAGILDENDAIADHVKDHMGAHGILVVNEMGAPGVGKTTTLKGIFKHLPEEIKPYVIEGDIESDIDTVDLKGQGIYAYQINTYGACHLDAPMIDHAIDHMDLSKRGILFIENVGNLVCPAEFSIGEHVKMLISTVTEGSDKPYKYPLAFEKADVIIINKVDLIPYLDFVTMIMVTNIIITMKRDIRVIYMVWTVTIITKDIIMAKMVIRMKTERIITNKNG